MSKSEENFLRKLSSLGLISKFDEAVDWMDVIGGKRTCFWAIDTSVKVARTIIDSMSEVPEVQKLFRHLVGFEHVENELEKAIKHYSS